MNIVLSGLRLMRDQFNRTTINDFDNHTID